MCAKKAGTTALVTWISVCLVFILLATLEYAWILGMTRIRTGAIEASEKAEVVKTSRLCARHALRIDRLMLILFPVIFSVTAASFWNSI